MRNFKAFVALTAAFTLVIGGLIIGVNLANGDENQYAAFTSDNKSVSSSAFESAALSGGASVVVSAFDSASVSSASVPSGGETTPPRSGRIITDSALFDDHQGETTAEDAAWQRYDLYAAAVPGVDGVTVADSVALSAGQGGTFPTFSTDRPNSENYCPIGKLTGNTDACIEFTINLSAAAKVGIYGQFSNRAMTDPLIAFNDVFSLSINGEVQNTSGVYLPQGGSNFAPANRYVFLGYADLKAGANTVAIKVVMPKSGNNGYNFYGFRFSAQTATVSVA